MIAQPLGSARAAFLLDGPEHRGHVAGAALDVFATEPPPADHPLFGTPNFICTPHLGASTDEAQVNVALQVAEQLSDYLLTGGVTNALNMPVSARRESDGSLTVYVPERAVDGKANGAVIRLLAVHFGVPRRDVDLISGSTGRTKRFRIG